jgi:elongation factor P
MFSASDLRKGLKVLVEGQPYTITEFEFCKPGKGTALYRCKLKHLLNGSTLDRTYRPNDKLDRPDLEVKEVTYVYAEGTNFVFSDNENYEEIRVNGDVLGNSRYFLIEQAECSILFFNGNPVEVTLPIFVEKQIVQTDAAVRGDTATNVTKDAKLDNGAVIQVPLFVNEGDWVKIDTRTGSYSERVKKG